MKATWTSGCSYGNWCGHQTSFFKRGVGVGGYMWPAVLCMYGPDNEGAFPRWRAVYSRGIVQSRGLTASGAPQWLWCCVSIIRSGTNSGWGCKARDLLNHAVMKHWTVYSWLFHIELALWFGGVEGKREEKILKFRVFLFVGDTWFIVLKICTHVYAFCCCCWWCVR